MNTTESNTGERPDETRRKLVLAALTLLVAGLVAPASADEMGGLAGRVEAIAAPLVGRLGFSAWRERLGKIGAIRVMNPAGSDISVAAATRIGQLSTAIDLMNSKGLYIEFNNADNTRPSSLPTNMRAIDDMAYSLVADYQSVAELNVVVPNIKSSDALLMLAADPTEARYFELSPYFSVRTEPEFLDGQLTARGNHALHPAWNMDAESDPERTIAFSMLRRSNMVKYLSADPSTNDDATMRAFLSKQIIVDGKPSDGAACIMEPAIKIEDWTAYQTVTIPEERKLFWRIPTHTPRLEFDLTKYFTTADRAMQRLPFSDVRSLHAGDRAGGCR